MKQLRFFVIPLTFLVLGCEDKTPAPEPTPVPVKEEPTNQVEQPTKEVITVTPRWETIKGQKEYTAYAIKHLKDSGEFLLNGNYGCMEEVSTKPVTDRLSFYVYLLSLMAEHESYFRPTLEYKEKFKDQSGNYVISTGLFQVSLESSQQKRYDCGFTKQSDLYDPEMNMRCAIRILTALTKENGCLMSGKIPYKGGSRYWSVLRAARAKAYDDIVQKMKEVF